MIPLAYALLGLLARVPGSGYDLIRELEEPVGFFWHARRSQIYPALTRLEKQGYITHTVVEQQDRPDKKVYEITDAGRAALAAWAVESMRIPPERDVFMLKVFSLWLADPHQAINLIRGYASQHTERLARYEDISAALERTAELEAEPQRISSPRFISAAMLRRGIEYERGYVSWCRWMIETIEREHPERTERME